MSFKQDEAINILNSNILKWTDLFKKLGSNVSTTNA